MTRPLSIALALAVAMPAARASAGAGPRPEPGRQLAGILVAGPAVARDVHVDVRCDGEVFPDSTASCEIRARFVLVAMESVDVQPAPAELVEGLERQILGQVVVGGAPLTGSMSLAEGSETAVEISAECTLAVDRDWPVTPWLIPPMLTRHTLFGESTWMRRMGDSIDGRLLVGGARIDGAITASAEHAEDVSVRIGATDFEGAASITEPTLDMRISLRAPPPSDGGFQNGGPLLALGWRGALSTDQGRFLARIGYEVAFADYVFASLAFETDFDSIIESVLVEAVSPGLFILVPSLSAGIGFVARQLGPRDADAGLRLAVGAYLYVVGFDGAFDYWPAIGDWTATLTGRISI